MRLLVGFHFLGLAAAYCLLLASAFAQAGDNLKESDLEPVVKSAEAHLRELHRSDPLSEAKVIDGLVIKAYAARARGDDSVSSALIEKVEALCKQRMAKADLSSEKINLLLLQSAIAEDFRADIKTAALLMQKAIELDSSDSEAATRYKRLSRQLEAAGPVAH